MKTIKLEATGFEIEVPDNLHYHDDGIVRSIAKHESKLYKEYGRRSEYKYKQLFGELLIKRPSIRRLAGLVYKPIPLYAGGYSYFFNWKDNSVSEAIKEGVEVHIHTFVLSGFPEPKTIFFRGHEETHFLLDTKKTDVLTGRLKNLGIGTEGFLESSEEVKCDLGGLCAILRKFPGNKFSVSPNFSTTDEFVNYLRRNTTWRVD